MTTLSLFVVGVMMMMTTTMMAAIKRRLNGGGNEVLCSGGRQIHWAERVRVAVENLNPTRGFYWGHDLSASGSGFKKDDDEEKV
jgi:hypothetical protein